MRLLVTAVLPTFEPCHILDNRSFNMAVPTSLSNLLDALPNSENKLDVLGDIKLIVNSMNANNVRESVRNVSFNVIFECLDTTDRCVRL